jgi:uncharacterized membrane protein YwzB
MCTPGPALTALELLLVQAIVVGIVVFEYFLDHLQVRQVANILGQHPDARLA